MKNERLAVQLHIDKHYLTFLSNGKLMLMVNMGYDKLISHYFKSTDLKTLPTPYNLEVAINATEDSIENAVHALPYQWKPHHTNVTYDDEWIKKIAQYCQPKFNGSIDSGELEQLFNRVCDVVSGSPKRESEFPDTLIFISYLLIVRELVHHLAIKGLILKGTTEVEAENITD